MTISKGLKQAYDMQDLAYEAAMALRSTLTLKDQALSLKPMDKETAQMLGTLGKLWVDAQERIRIHRGKPLPGSLTHEKVKQPRARRATSLEDVMLRYQLPAEPTATGATEQQPAAEPTTDPNAAESATGLAAG